jgi:hypothetical protein
VPSLFAAKALARSCDNSVVLPLVVFVVFVLFVELVVFAANFVVVTPVVELWVVVVLKLAATAFVGDVVRVVLAKVPVPEFRPFGFQPFEFVVVLVSHWRVGFGIHERSATMPLGM